MKIKFVGELRRIELFSIVQICSFCCEIDPGCQIIGWAPSTPSIVATTIDREVALIKPPNVPYLFQNPIPYIELCSSLLLRAARRMQEHHVLSEARNEQIRRFF